ncbi:DNA repair protein RecO [Caldilinea sp.]|jgi:DNA repair protein RecO (recombination protein O)|uniref:DNA repair protein RecO n=2 Tax=Caldilinea sp. TaxID=2293560 RepID=UPI0021DDEFA3|nr:DNA repair protein RecO [Caldilinea sp.]GIV67999.1 MAG: DNA repair protein RecO [Caldilinea sp.]
MHMPARERIRSTRALILRRRDIHDADRVLTALTPGEGKLELIAKGVRKTSSRKAGHLEPFVHVALTLAQGSTWDIITEAQTVESFRHLRSHLEAIAAASYICELVDAFTGEGEDAHAIWDLTLEALRILDEAAAYNAAPANLLPWFALHLLSLTGFQPQFFRCLACDKELEPTVNFLALAEGGVLCPQCAAQRNDAEALDVDALKVLRFFQSRPWTTVAQVNARPATLRRVENILNRYLIIVLERQVRSTHFLRRLTAAHIPQS